MWETWTMCSGRSVTLTHLYSLILLTERWDETAPHFSQKWCTPALLWDIVLHDPPELIQRNALLWNSTMSSIPMHSKRTSGLGGSSAMLGGSCSRLSCCCSTDACSQYMNNFASSSTDCVDHGSIVPQLGFGMIVTSQLNSWWRFLRPCWLYTVL